MLHAFEKSAKAGAKNEGCTYGVGIGDAGLTAFGLGRASASPWPAPTGGEGRERE